MRLRIALIAAWACALMGAPAVYRIAPGEGAHVTLRVDKTGLMSGKQHVFTFERYAGALTYDADAPERSRVELSIEAASLVCRDTWVSEKDRGRIEKVAREEMLGLPAHAKIEFRSSHVTRRGPKAFDVAGTLAIRGVERPVVVSVSMEGEGSRLERVAGKATVRLKDYGLKAPGAALGMIGTKNEMTVEFVVVAR